MNACHCNSRLITPNLPAASRLLQKHKHTRTQTPWLFRAILRRKVAGSTHSVAKEKEGVAPLQPKIEQTATKEMVVSYNDMFAISTVYFVQGIVSLSTLAISYFLKDTLMQTPAQVGFIESYGKLPWIIKPLYGFASDLIPIFGYKHKSYLVLCGIVSSAAWFLMAGGVHESVGAFLCIFIAWMGTACSDVVIDGVVVSRTRGAPQSTAGSLQSLCWASVAVGGIISAYCSGYVVENYGPRTVFAAIGFFPLLVSCSALFVSETPVSVNGENSDVDSVRLMTLFKSQMKSLWVAFSNKQILLPSIFMFLWMATPNSSPAMFFYYTNHLHFTPEFMGRVNFVGQVASLGGVGLYQFYLKEVPMRKMFFWTTILGTVLGMTQLVLVTGLNESLGLSNQLFVIGDSIILEAVGKVAFMQVLVLAARICPEGMEATLFALLMSILNGGSLTGQALGAELTQVLGVNGTDFSNLPLLVVICVMCTLIPLPFISLIPKQTRQSNHDL